MRLNSKLSWGLAWAGLALVVAVPSADYLTSQPGSAAVITTDTTPVIQTDTAPVKTAAIDPVVAEPVLPAITPAAPTTSTRTIELAPGSNATPLAPTPVAAEPAAPAADPVTPAVTAAPAPEPVQVASVAQPKTVPFPTPVSQRPTAPAAAPAAPAGEEIFIPQEIAGPSPEPMGEPMMLEPEGQDDIIVTGTTSNGPRPPAGIENDPNVGDPESLRDYLIRRGLFEEGGGSVDVWADAEYDADGFFLDEGPDDSSVVVQRQRLDRTTRSDSGENLSFFLF